MSGKHFAILALVLTAAACGTTHENSGQGTSTSAAACKGTDGKYTIGVSQANVAEPYRKQMDDDIARAAKQYPQFTVNFADAQ